MKGVSNFLNPRTIAIIGASDHVDKVGRVLMQKALKSKCKIFPVNPSHLELFGQKCYNAVSEIKSKIDLAVIAIPREFVISSLRDCGKKGIKNVILISAGFSEVGDKNAELELMNLARKYDMRVLGPNCFGVFNPKINLDLTFADITPKKGNVTFISQSGALWSYLSNMDFGFSGFIGLGNMADLEFNDFIEYFSKDSETKKIVLYIEKLKDGKKFIEVCKKAVASGKKVYAIKTGLSKEGARASFSHTASLASDYEIYKGIFKQSGVIFCDTLEEALELKNKSFIKKVKLGKRVSIISNAGGAGALASDYLSSRGFKIIQNKDLLGTAKSTDYAGALKEKLEYDWVLIILTAQSMTDVDEIARAVVNASKSLDSQKKVIALFLGKESMKQSNEFFNRNEITSFNDFPSFINSL